MIDDQILLEALEQTDKGVCILDRKLTIRFWNRWLVQKTGIRSDDIHGNPLLSVIKKGARQYVLSRLEEVLRSGLSTFFSQSFNKFLIEIPITSSHQFRYMQQKVVAKAILRDNTTAFIVIFVDDVTLESERIYDLSHHRRNLEKRVKQRTKQLQEAKEDLEIEVRDRTWKLEKAKEAAEIANVAKNAFLANVSHEIRTPMNAILGFSEILSELITDPQQKNYISTVTSSGKLLLTVIDDILDISKIEAGELKIEYTPTNLAEVFSDTVSIFAQQAKKKQIRLQVSIPDNLPQSLLMDEVRIRQILINLVGNAVKFTDKGYIKLSVDLVYKATDSNQLDLVIRVEDTGIGIPEDQQEFIFMAFRQQKEQDHAKYGGSGLGLSITKKLLEFMKGSISVSSQCSEGAVFIVRLNDVVIHQSSFEHRKQVGREGDIEALSGHSILIADDARSNRELLISYLNDFDCKTIEAADGEEVFGLVEMHLPDLVLLDLHMPRMDGIAAARGLKKDTRFRHIPVLGISARTIPQDEATNMEFDDFMQIPVSKQQFLSTVFKHLERKKDDMTPNSDHTRKDKAESSDNISGSYKQTDLELLFDLLVKEKKEVWTDLIDTMTINEVESFALKIKSLGLEYDYQPLLLWCERLQSQVTSFDVIELPKTLKEFERIINQLNKTLQT